MSREQLPLHDVDLITERRCNPRTAMRRKEGSPITRQLLSTFSMGATILEFGCGIGQDVN